MPQKAGAPRTGAAVDKRAIFRSHALFQQLGEEEIARLVAYARVERVKAGTTIFLKDSPGHGMMAVLAGEVKISVPSADGKEAVLNLIGPGEVFGEIALLDGQPRTADATATVDCELLVLERRDFIPFLERHPEVCIRLMEILCARLRRTSEQVEDMLFLDLPSRLAKMLLRLARERGRTMAEGLVVDLRLSQRELGNMTGATRESINKQLRQWQNAGWLKLERTTLTLLAPRRLEAIAEGNSESRGA